MLSKLAFAMVGLQCVLVGTLNGACADDDFSKQTVKATPLTQSIYLLEGAGGNMTASIGTDGVLLVDDDFAQMSEKILAKLRELKGGSPRYVVNTHFHYDHTGGNEAFSGTATIIAAVAVRDRLMAEQTLWKKQHPPVSPKALPQVTFEKELTLHFNQDEVRIIHFPNGHTDGDSVVIFFRGKVVSMGDLYFAGMYPIFHPEHEGSLANYVRSIELVLSQIPDDAKIVPGHGPVTDKAALEKYRRMTRASIETVRTGIRRGLSLAQIQKAGLAPEWEPFSHGYRNTDQWLESIYRGLKKGR
jgi:glyoxylase-like metal-dependent hydrolase (beta-lactamase superfamily II)